MWEYRLPSRGLWSYITVFVGQLNLQKILGRCDEMKTLVVVMLLLVVGSLFSALYFMYRDKGNSKRMVTALTFRIVLSVSIFLVLIGGYYFGLIPRK